MSEAQAKALANKVLPSLTQKILETAEVPGASAITGLLVSYVFPSIFGGGETHPNIQDIASQLDKALSQLNVIQNTLDSIVVSVNVLKQTLDTLIHQQTLLTYQTAVATLRTQQSSLTYIFDSMIAVVQSLVGSDAGTMSTSLPADVNQVNTANGNQAGLTAYTIAGTLSDSQSSLNIILAYIPLAVSDVSTFHCEHYAQGLMSSTFLDGLWSNFNRAYSLISLAMLLYTNIYLVRLGGTTMVTTARINNNRVAQYLQQAYALCPPLAGINNADSTYVFDSTARNVTYVDSTGTTVTHNVYTLWRCSIFPMGQNSSALPPEWYIYTSYTSALNSVSQANAQSTFWSSALFGPSFATIPIPDSSATTTSVCLRAVTPWWVIPTVADWDTLFSARGISNLPGLSNAGFFELTTRGIRLYQLWAGPNTILHVDQDSYDFTTYDGSTPGYATGLVLMCAYLPVPDDTTATACGDF